MRVLGYKNKDQSATQAPLQGSLASIMSLLVLHVILSLLFREFRFFSTIHAVLVLILGLYTALTTKDLAQVVPYAAYIMGADVLWRMTKAQVFWEYGKYAIVLLLLVALFKQRKPLENLIWPIFSFVLLLPSTFLTVAALGFTETSREFISFNLSGPLATFICILFFSQVTMDQEALKRSIWAAVYPIISVLTLAIVSTLTSTTIYFGSESVFVTSGGYGPNQVSAVLGLAALLLILYAFQPKKYRGRSLALIIALLLIVQSFLTFSRGGIINLVIALGLAFLFLLRRPSKIIRPLFVLFIILIIVGFVIFPQLEELTSGAFSARFSDIDPISRVNLAQADFDLFLANPIAGVGPGMATFLRVGVMNVAAHTEYSRLLAEHGTLGIISFAILAGMLLRTLLRTNETMARAWLVASAGWAAVEMAHAAMRIVAISFMLGIAFVTFKLDESPLPEQELIRIGTYKFRRHRKLNQVE